MTAQRRRPDDLAGRWLTRFFIDHLAGERAASPRTIASYRDAIKLLLVYFKTAERIPPEKLRLADIDRPRVLRFLDWLEAERGCSTATRNQRLAVIKSFCRYTAVEQPDHLEQVTQVLAIRQKKTPSQKKTPISRSGPCWSGVAQRLGRGKVVSTELRAAVRWLSHQTCSCTLRKSQECGQVLPARGEERAPRQHRRDTRCAPVTLLRVALIRERHRSRRLVDVAREAESAHAAQACDRPPVRVPPASSTPVARRGAHNRTRRTLSGEPDRAPQRRSVPTRTTPTSPNRSQRGSSAGDESDRRAAGRSESRNLDRSREQGIAREQSVEFRR